jgi:Fe-S oxidoreductase
MSQIVFALCLLIAFSIFGWTINRFVRFMLQGRAFDGKFDHLTARVGDVLVYFLGQRSVTRERASLHHALIFWGFLVIAVGTLELMIKGLWTPFDYAMIVGTTLGNGFKFVLDLTNGIVLLVMAYSFFRRLVLRPNLIPLSADAALILGMISALCVTHFLMHGYSQVLHGEVHAQMPISAAVAGILAGTSPGAAATGHQVNFWIHLLIVLFFLNYIPYSKHVHLLGALPNIFLRNRGQKGVAPKRDLEDEQQWGVGFYERFSWKDLLDTYACTECARCSNNCPAYATDKPLSPMHLIHDIRDEMRARGDRLIQLRPGIDPHTAAEYDEDEVAGGAERRKQLQSVLAALPAGSPGEVLLGLARIFDQRGLDKTERLELALSEMEEDPELTEGVLRHKLWGVLQELQREARTPAKPCDADLKIIEGLEEQEPLVGGRIKSETLWACVTCGACEAVCPVFIEHPQKIIEMRGHLVQAAEETPAELARIFRGLENNQNPWGIGSDQRMDWAEGLDVPIWSEVIEQGEPPEYLVWIGCAGSYDDRAKKISIAWVKLLKQAGVSFAVLGLEEGCTGDAARRAGNEFLFQTMAEMNIELFNTYGVKKILVTCPHCYHSFKNEYPQFGGHYQVWHHSTFIRRLLADGIIKPSRTVSEALTYHDSCYLGRWNEIYQDPREVAAAACGGARPREMQQAGYKSFCCGAGGGRMWMEEEAPRINNERTDQALATGADTIATACPFCIVMISDGIKARDREEEVQVLDLAELVVASLQVTEPQPGADQEQATEQAT